MTGLRLGASYFQVHKRGCMKIAFTYNLRLSDAEEEAEFDSPRLLKPLPAR